jgi:hypothetical protein
MSHNLTPKSSREFENARRQAFLEEVFRLFTGKSTDLLPFETVRSQLELYHTRNLGLQDIELDKIVGSVGRYQDFSRTFLPRSDSQAERWLRVDGVAHTSAGYPPIEVYKIGEVYFVRDGNHRVSVARAHKTPTIEAYVTEYLTDIPLRADDDLDDILIKADQAHFLKVTQLDRHRPDQDLKVTEPGRYQLLLEHIGLHKHFKQIESGRELSIPEAAASWLDQEYLPVVRAVREYHLLEQFPNRTETDLYTWLALHRGWLEQYYGLGQVSIEDMLADLEEAATTRPGYPLQKIRQTIASLLSPGQRETEPDLNAILTGVDYASFVRVTRLDLQRPDHNLNLTHVEHYRLLLDYIGLHKYLKELEGSQELSLAAAAGSWYDHEYLPIIHSIRAAGLSSYFPKQTEADLYVMVAARRSRMENQRGLGRVPFAEVLEMIQAETNPNLLERLGQSVGRLVSNEQ